MEQEREKEMTLWQEMFTNPVPCEFTAQEWNEAWNWLFCDKETATLKLTIARRHSIALRRQGCVRTAEMAVCGLMRRNSLTGRIERKMPVRNGLGDTRASRLVLPLRK